MTFTSPRDAGSGLSSIRVSRDLGRGSSQSFVGSGSLRGVQVKPTETHSTSLPVWSIHVSLYFYPRHQAWYSHALVTEQVAENVKTHQERELEWGPFDTSHEALQWAQSQLTHAMGLPGVPWGSPAA